MEVLAEEYDKLFVQLLAKQLKAQQRNVDVISTSIVGQQYNNGKGETNDSIQTRYHIIK